MRTTDRARYAAVRDAAIAALERGVGGRWTLPGGGLLAMDRPLPFIVIGRLGSDDTVLRLTGGFASRLIVSSERVHARGVSALEQTLVGALAERSRALLVFRLTEGAESERESAQLRARLPADPRWAPLEEPIARALADISSEGGVRVLVALERDGGPSRDALRLEPHLRERVCELELTIFPRHRDATGAPRYPMRLFAANRTLAWGLARVADAFTDRELKRVRPRPRLGSAALDPAAQEADSILCKAADSFDVLLKLTPAHLDRVWRRLVETRFEEEPRLTYRPLPFDPLVIKRRVLEAPVEAIEDPFIAELLREKQEELDRLLSMLRNRGKTFLYESELVFGRPEPELVDLAERILALPRATPNREQPEEKLGLDAILRRTREHMRRYRDQDPLFPDEIELRGDTAASMMVLRGRLLLRTDLRLDPHRLDALLEHEVGTHVLTWFNGSAQPLRLLGRGLAGYDGLQEGLAVLAEHLAGALDPSRLRLLAARVIAAEAIGLGDSFLEVFHRLRSHGLDERAAFQTTIRAARGGGLTKDIVYLRGLCEVLAHLRAGGSLDRLYTGKIALRHLEVVHELVERGLIAPPRVVPMVLREARTAEKLEVIRASEDDSSVVTQMAGWSAA